MKRYYDPLVFNHMLDGIDRDKYVIATYYVEDTVQGVDFLDHFKLLQSIIVEGSTGSWMEVKEELGAVREKYAGKLLGYYEIPAENGLKKAVFQAGYSIESWGKSVPMMLLSSAGNCFIYSPKLRLLDVCFPKELVKEFQGPKFGIDGIREMTGVEERPLTLHIIKPKMGMTPEQIASQVYETAMGGVDMVKDDEMTSDTAYCSFDERLEAVMGAINRAEETTGKKVLYFISITDEVNRINRMARRAVDAGANGLLLCYSAGPSALRVLAEDPKVGIPILLHPSHMLAMINRISYPVFAKLGRLCGADMMLTPSYWSTTPVVSLEEGLRASQVLTAPFFHIKRTWPMPAAGMHPGLLQVLVNEHGKDIIVPAGGGMLGHPDGYRAGAMAWIQAAEAVNEGTSLGVAAADKPELRSALEHWGELRRPSTPWLRAGPQYHPKTTGQED